MPHRLRLPLLLTLVLPLAAQEPPEAPEASRPELSAQELTVRPLGTRLFSLSARRQDAEASILEFARRAGVNVVFLDRPATLVSIVFKDLPFEHAFRDLLAAAEMTYRKLDGDYVVGSTLDMRLRFPNGEKTLDATYRCRRIDAQSLIASLRPLFPSDLAMARGPLFLTPPLDGQNGGSGMAGTTGGKGNLTGIGDNFKTHDVVFAGPAEMVRRALTLARKCDRPRKMARIIVKIVEVTNSQEMNLGMDWMDSLSLVAVEQPKDGNAYTPGVDNKTVIDGIRLGRFSHSPLVVNATINALEAKGYAKTVANPTLLLLDGERSYLQAGSNYTFPVFTTLSSSGQPEYSTQTSKIGVYLQVGVQIGLDNDLTLSLFPQVTFNAGRNVVNGGEFPIIGTREVQTSVRAISGEMIVLGGLLQDIHTETRNGLPFLSRIPVLGRLFGSTDKITSKSELMVFVTPEIVEDPVPPAKVEISIKEGP